MRKISFKSLTSLQRTVMKTVSTLSGDSVYCITMPSAFVLSFFCSSKLLTSISSIVTFFSCIYNICMCYCSWFLPFCFRFSYSSKLAFYPRSIWFSVWYNHANHHFFHEHSRKNTVNWNVQAVKISIAFSWQSIQLVIEHTSSWKNILAEWSVWRQKQKKKEGQKSSTW